jgi:hypothetical protein
MNPKSIHINRFISPTIYKHIVEKEGSLTEHTISIGRHNITIFTSGSHNGIMVNSGPAELQLAKAIFEEVQRLARADTIDTIHSYIYLLDFPKKLDLSKDNVTSAECNSASTTFYIAEQYVEVVLWRKEEWAKVLYHELIHAFIIDYSVRVNKDGEERLKALLVHYNNSIREAYTETLATLLEINRTNGNIKDQCIFLGTQVNKIAFYIECPREELVVFERDTIAVLDDKEGIDYISMFFNSPKRILDTSTNTSSYYILKSIYLWCGVYKDSDLLSPQNMLDKGFINKKFYSVLIEALESGEYVQWLKSIYFKPTNSSLRLSLT